MESYVQIDQTKVDAFCRDIEGIYASTDLKERQNKSKDFHWYSPILTPKLAHCLADVVVRPRSVSELERVVSAAAKHRLPVTVRGGGTGNYGQSVPLRGGVVLEMTGINRIVAVRPGRVVVEAGAKLKDVLEAALHSHQQLMMYPSTMSSATVGGYLCGGFAGIGSVKHGIIRDSGMVLALKVLTVEEAPKVIELSGSEAQLLYHSWGTSGIIFEATIKLVPEEQWIDCITTFPTYGDAIAFGNAAFESSLDIFLLSSVERRFAPFYKRTQKYFDGTRDAMFSMVNVRDVDAFFDLAKGFGGCRAMAVSEQESAAAQLRPIHQTAFNHTTLMALQVDRSWTYLQLVMPIPFTPALAQAQLQRFGDEVLMHHEFTRENGRIRVGGLPLIRYTTEDRLNQIMASFEEDGCAIHNPHIFKLEDGGRFDPDGRKLSFRAKADPMNLLNPGKLRTIS